MGLVVRCRSQSQQSLSFVRKRQFNARRFPTRISDRSVQNGRRPTTWECPNWQIFSHHTRDCVPRHRGLVPHEAPVAPCNNIPSKVTAVGSRPLPSLAVAKKATRRARRHDSCHGRNGPQDCAHARGCSHGPAGSTVHRRRRGVGCESATTGRLHTRPGAYGPRLVGFIQGLLMRKSGPPPAGLSSPSGRLVSEADILAAMADSDTSSDEEERVGTQLDSAFDVSPASCASRRTWGNPCSSGKKTPRVFHSTCGCFRAPCQHDAERVSRETPFPWFGRCYARARNSRP